MSPNHQQFLHSILQFIEENPSEIQHIALGDWADAIIVAPATANTIAKPNHQQFLHSILQLYLPLQVQQ
jgi:phosphopantothenoylcysteine synthetase/decarboxylase